MNKIDNLEKRIRDQVLVHCGFAYPEVLARKLESKIKAYDLKKTGFLDFKGFFAAMSKLNFVAMTKDIEMLFNRYDEDGTGLIDYKLFSQCVCEFYSIGIYEPTEKQILARLLNKLVCISGVDCMYGLKNSIRNMSSRNGSTHADEGGLVTCDNFINGILAFDVYISDRELDALYSSIRKAAQGTPSLLFVMNALRSGHDLMTFERKAFLRQTFYSLVELVDSMGGGDPFGSSPNALTLGQLLDRFDAHAHPSVISGLLTTAQCVGQMVDLFELGVVNKSSRSSNGLSDADLGIPVTYESFLTYYKSISLAISDATKFNELVRNSWMVAPNKYRDGIERSERDFVMPEQLAVDEPAAMGSNFYGVSTRSSNSTRKLKSPQASSPSKSKLRSFETIMTTVGSPSLSPAEARRTNLKGTVKYFYGNDSLKAEREKETMRANGCNVIGRPYTRRVILCHSDGSESTVDFVLSPDGGDEPVYRVPDKREMMLQLRREGHRDVEDIRM